MPTMPNFPMPNFPLPNLALPESLRQRPPRRQSPVSGLALTPSGDQETETAIVDCAVYRDGYRVAGINTWSQAVDEVERARGGFAWIGLHEPTEDQLSGLAARLGLHPLAVEDAVHAHQRPKLERYGDDVFAVVKTVHYNDDDSVAVSEVVETGEVMVFLGRDFVVTVRHGVHGELHGLRTSLEADPTLLAQGPSTVLHAVLDHAVDGYLTAVAALQQDVDEIETAVFRGDARASQTSRIYLLKREVVELRRAVGPLTEPLRQLAETSMPPVAASVRAYFRDVNDHLQRVVDQVLAFDDLLNTLVAANLAQAGVLQNEDMRKISAWVAIVSVPTMVAGIYGMNFDNMPELHWHYSYFCVLVLVAVACLFLHRAFRRSGWL